MKCLKIRELGIITEAFHMEVFDVVLPLHAPQSCPEEVKGGAGWTANFQLLLEMNLSIPSLKR